MDMADETVLDADRVSEMIAPTLVAGTPQKHHRHHDDLLRFRSQTYGLGR